MRWVTFHIVEHGRAHPLPQVPICLDGNGSVGAVCSAWLTAIRCRAATILSFRDRFHHGYPVLAHLQAIGAPHFHIGRLSSDPHPEDPEAFTYLLVTSELDAEQMDVIAKRFEMPVLWRVIRGGTMAYGQDFVVRMIRL